MFEISLFRKHTASAAEHITSLRADLERVKAERQAIANAPATRAEVKAMVSAWAEGKAARYLKRLQFNMQEFITNPLMSLANAGVIEHRMTLFGKSRQAGEFGMYPGPELNDEAICCLLGPALVVALHAQIDAMEWPAGAIPLAGRDKKLADLDRTIAKLKREESDLADEVRRSLAI